MKKSSTHEINILYIKTTPKRKGLERKNWTMKSTYNVFDLGRYTVEFLIIETEAEKSNCSSSSSSSSSSTSISYLRPPKPLLVAAPSDGGEFEFPVVILLHGYLLNNFFYSQLMKHVASHGFIVITPQLYSIAGPDCEEEINSVAKLTDWLINNLTQALKGVKPNLTKLAISGHSRGGKVAFALALSPARTKLKFSALIAIDPVDGMDKGKQTNPPILTYIPHSFDLQMATLVIGSGLGGLKKNVVFPPCAPKGVSHEDFFEECCAPSWHFVGEEYGHLDMLDDETKGLKGKLSHCLCKNGKERKAMREFVGGVMVAFLRGYLDCDMKDLVAIRDEPKLVPIEYSVDSFV